MSAIRYLCPSCQTTVSAPARAAGKTLPCPACGAKAIVPVSLPPETRREEFDFQDHENSESPSQPKRRFRRYSSGARVVLWLLFVLGALFVEGMRKLTDLVNIARGISPEDTTGKHLGEIATMAFFFMLCFACDRMIVASRDD